jgi:hypothetical protein
MSREAIQTVTTALAVLGAVLGLYNAWRNWIQDRLRIRVKASFGVGPAFGRDGHGISIDIVNLSTFPVTITHVGFDLLIKDGHMQIPSPFFAHGQSLPIRLEPRTAATVLVARGALPDDNWGIVRNAYISTACGAKCTSGTATFDAQRISIALENSPGA